MEKRRSGRLCLDTFLKDVVKNAMTEKAPLDQATEKVKTHLSDGLLKTGDKDAAKFRRRKNSFSQEKTDFFFHTREEEDNNPCTTIVFFFLSCGLQLSEKQNNH